jgi:excisionase family DNA binding protein
MIKTTSPQNIYPSVDALAKELGISRQTAYVNLNNGTIPSIRLGKRFILPKSAIQSWLQNAGSMVTPA